MVENINKMKNLEDFLLNNINIDKLDFIGFVTSGWHLNVLYSYIYANRNLHSKGLIIIGFQGDINNKSKFRINKKMIKNIPNIKINYVIKSPLQKKNKFISLINLAKNLIKSNKKNNKPITILSPNNINTSLLTHSSLNFKSRDLYFIEIDEGTGSYVSKNHFLKSLDHNFLSCFKTHLKSLIIKFFFTITHTNTEKYYLFHKKSVFHYSRLKVNNNVASNLKKFLKKYNKEINGEKNQILILKDFVKNNKKLDELYLSIIKNLKKFTNKKIYIKKHPNDIDKNFDKNINNLQNAEIITTNYDAEEVYIQYKPQYIIGGISTALFSISAIYNKNVINISNLYFNEKYKLPKLYLKRLIKFKRYFSENEKIKYINKVKDFQNLIS